MKKIHQVENVAFQDDKMLAEIDGKEFVFLLKKISEPLLKATRVQRETFEISPSGYGIHWPLIDEDLSIDGLLGIKHKFSEKKKAA